MKSKLLKGLNDDDKSELTAQFVHSARLRRQMVKILNEDIESLQAQMRSEELYDSPNWALVQADRLAQTKALKKFIAYLED